MGWKTRSYREKFFFHYRHLVTAERSAFAASFSYGEKDYYLGGSPIWELFRVSYRFFKPPYLVDGLARRNVRLEGDELFAGDPTWVTESIAGMGDDGRPLVTKTSFRFLHTLYNLGPAPEPNLTIWYSPRLPDNFRKFAAKVAIDTSSIIRS